MVRRQSGANIMMSLAMILFCLVLVSTYLMGGLYARYTTSGSAADEARVAEFLISGSLNDGAGQEIQTIQLSMLPEEEKNFTISIQSDSEVAVAFEVTATNESKNLPLLFTLKEGSTSCDSDDEVSLSGEIAPNDTTIREFDLTIKWEDNATSYTYNRGVELITVALTYRQVD